MKERTELAGGRFIVRSHPGKGTRIEAHFARELATGASGDR